MARIESSIIIDAPPGVIRSQTDDLASSAEFTDGRLTLMLEDAVAVSGSTLKGTLSLSDRDIPFTARIAEASIERLAWETTASDIPMRGEITARAAPEGSRVIFSLETGPIGGIPGSRAEKQAIRELQDIAEAYVRRLRDALVAPTVTIDLAGEERVIA